MSRKTFTMRDDELLGEVCDRLGSLPSEVDVPKCLKKTCQYVNMLMQARNLAIYHGNIENGKNAVNAASYLISLLPKFSKTVATCREIPDVTAQQEIMASQRFLTDRRAALEHGLSEYRKSQAAGVTIGTIISGGNPLPSTVLAVLLDKSGYAKRVLEQVKKAEIEVDEAARMFDCRFK